MYRYDDKTDANRKQFAQVIKEFTDVSRKNYDGHSYAAGYLEALAPQMLAYMSHKDQAMFIDWMQKAAEKQRQEFEERAGNRTFERV